jgi:hypothetical protein
LDQPVPCHVRGVQLGIVIAQPVQTPQSRLDQHDRFALGELLPRTRIEHGARWIARFVGGQKIT